MNRLSRIIKITLLITISVLFGSTIASSIPVKNESKSIEVYPYAINVTSIGH